MKIISVIRHNENGAVSCKTCDGKTRYVQIFVMRAIKIKGNTWC